MEKLSSDSIQDHLKTVPGWSLQDGEIVRTFVFSSFVQSLQFVNRVGESAEAAGHHPDIDIRYDKVRLALVSHDAGGLTDKDFNLASDCDKIYLSASK